MSAEGANLVVAVASLVVAVVATWAAVSAIRRDRADLRVTFSGAAAGNRYLTVVNVGLRPVRIERVLVRHWRVAPRFGEAKAIGAAALLETNNGPETPLPVVLQPAGDVFLHLWPAGEPDYAGGPKSDIAVEDASGRRYRVRYSREVSPG